MNRGVHERCSCSCLYVFLNGVCEERFVNGVRVRVFVCAFV